MSNSESVSGHLLHFSLPYPVSQAARRHYRAIEDLERAAGVLDLTYTGLQSLAVFALADALSNKAPQKPLMPR